MQSAVSVWCTALCGDPGQVVVEDRLRRKQLQIKPFPKTHSELIIIVVSSRNSSQELNIISLYHQQCSGANCKSKGLYSYFQTEAQHLAAMKYDVLGDLGHEAAKRFHLVKPLVFMFRCSLPFFITSPSKLSHGCLTRAVNYRPGSLLGH